MSFVIDNVVLQEYMGIDKHIVVPSNVSKISDGVFKDLDMRVKHFLFKKHNKDILYLYK